VFRKFVNVRDTVHLNKTYLGHKLVPSLNNTQDAALWEEK